MGWLLVTRRAGVAVGGGGGSAAAAAAAAPTVGSATHRSISFLCSIHNRLSTLSTTIKPTVVNGSSSSNSSISVFCDGRYYSSTIPNCDEDTGGATSVSKENNKKKDQLAMMRKISLEYGNRRASYKRQVTKLRKSYMDEYLRHRAEDEAQRDALRAETTRRRLERQRAKNERSVENARRQEELRRQTHLAFQDHLRMEQQKRDGRKEIFRKARQVLINELEEEAKLWLTTPEEVEAAFTPEAEQLLWARPQGVLGVPNPSLDSHFWQYEGHTWDMSKTYKTQSEILLAEFEEEAYVQTNVDPTIWTPERIQNQEHLERKAKLRANVRLEGRKALLKRQKEYLDEENEIQEGEPPKPMPVPSLGVLANIRAQEKEGAELLLQDPTKFFIFDGKAGSSSDSLDASPEFQKKGPTDDVDETYSGPSLGVPIDIRDPLRTGQPQGRVFPIGVGKLPKPDTRTEKEKKRQEREERLWAAAQAQAKADSNELDLVAEEDREIGEPLDYDNNDDWDSDDEEWVKGLDPDKDSDILNLPREYRYREEDIDFVIGQLENKARAMQSHVRNTVQTMEQEARARLERAEELRASALAAGGDNDLEKTSGQEERESFFDAPTVEKLRKVGADVDKYENLMLSLTQDQLLSLFALEAQRRDAEIGTPSEASASIFESVPGLSREQIVGLTELESFMHIAEKTTAETITVE